MGYMKINNLYKNQDILLFKRCYAMLKLDGTSAHVSYNNGNLHFFGGCVKQETFEALFNKEELVEKLKELGYYKNPNVDSSTKVTVFGENIGGSVQGLSKRYGLNVKFVAFEVKIGESWLSVPNAKDVCDKLGIEFVDFWEVDTDLETLNKLRDGLDTYALKHGFGEHPSEGIVIRPLKEFTLNDGSRVIAKHKKDTERETKTPRVVDLEKQKILDDAQEIAEEWVVAKRLEHVLQKVLVSLDTYNIPTIIKGMIEDIKIEGQGEIVWSKEVEKAIGAKTAKLVKDTLRFRLESHEKV